LAAFIRANIEAISSEWERFAATLRPEESFNSVTLRNDIVEMLADITENMEQDQSPAEQKAKSQGEPGRLIYSEGAIVLHVASRVAMGVSPRQFVSEFRALRATVIRLWQRDSNEFDSASFDDMIRFNEAIDQILSEGVVNYSQEVERSRDLFLSILGHDLRNPLSAITGAADLLLRGKAPERHAQFSSQILVSARRMSRLINDLLELARVRLGAGIVLHRAPTNLHRICNTVVQEMRIICPDRTFHMEGDEALPGQWDENRLGQAISNLVSNAVQHGAVDSAVTVTTRNSGAQAEVSVHNEGAPIPPDLIPKLFDSFYRLDTNGESHSHNLGLGLYISKEIVVAHGGAIEVRSSIEQGTTFCIRLPSE
jgi:signal transduction histidine kinase